LTGIDFTDLKKTGVLEKWTGWIGEQLIYQVLLAAGKDEPDVINGFERGDIAWVYYM
jgi:hypothetical protein